MNGTEPKIGQTINVLRHGCQRYSTYHVVGETSRSWLLIPEGQDWIVRGYLKEPHGHYANYLVRLAKADLKRGDARLGTAVDVAIAQWAEEHRWRVKEKLDWATPDTIVAIAKMVGYTPLPEV